MPAFRLLLGLGLVAAVSGGAVYWNHAQARAVERAAIEAEAADIEPDYIPASQIIEYGHPNRLALPFLELIEIVLELFPGVAGQVDELKVVQSRNELEDGEHTETVLHSGIPE